MSDNYDGPQMAQKILRQQAEIERLRKENSTFSDSLAAKADRIDRLGEIVARQVAEIEQLRDKLDASEAVRALENAELKRLQIANAALLANIKTIETWHEEGKKLFDNYSAGLGAMFGLGKWWGERPWAHKP